MIDRYRDEVYATKMVHADAEKIVRKLQADDHEWLYRIKRWGNGDHTARIWIIGVYEIEPTHNTMVLLGWL